MFFFSSRRRHTRSLCDWSSDVCSSDLPLDRAIRPSFRIPRSFRQREGETGYKYARHPKAGESKEGECARPRSEERRVGKECRTRWTAYQQQKKEMTTAVSA